MLGIDEDVGHGSLPCFLLENVLNGQSIVDFVELDNLKGQSSLSEALLGLVAVGTSALAVHHDQVASDLGL